MKYLLFILLIAFDVENSNAQSVGPAILNVGGNTYTQTGVIYEWSVGELALVETMVCSKGSITNGLLQPILLGQSITSVTSVLPGNIISPNGDGKNDTWVIKDIENYPNNEVTVFDRAGRIIYAKKGYTNDWGGTLRGSPLNEDTYYYVLDLGPGQPKIKGFITIIRDRK